MDTEGGTKLTGDKDLGYNLCLLIELTNLASPNIKILFKQPEIAKVGKMP